MIKKISVFLFAVFVSLTAVEAAEGGTAPELNKKGLYYLENGDPVSASGYFIRAISIDPSNKYYCNNMGASLMRRGDYAAAEKFLQHAIALDPYYARALSNMSVALFHLGRYRESYGYYLRSKKTDSGYTESRFERGRVEKVIRGLSRKSPGDSRLKKILEHLEKERNGGDQ